MTDTWTVDEYRAYLRTEKRPGQSQGSELEETLVGQLRMAGLTDPEREYIFHESRGWRFDLAYPALRLAVEVEGGTWTGGRHTRGAGFEADCRKYAEAALAGWTVLRVTGGMIESGEALGFIERALQREGSEK